MTSGAWLDANTAWLTRAERWIPRVSEALRLRLWLDSEVTWDGYWGLTIEGLLQSIVVTRETGDMPDDVFCDIDRDLNVDIPIPVSTVNVGDQPIACASWCWPASLAEETVRRRRKRTRVENMGDARTVSISGGRFKNLDIPVATLTTPYLDVFVRGDARLLGDLLRDVTALGRWRSGGMGLIHGVEIAADPEDRSVVWREQPQRAIPAMVDGGEFDLRRFDPGSFYEREATVRSPYWKRTSHYYSCGTIRAIHNEVMCIVPGLSLAKEAVA